MTLQEVVARFNTTPFLFAGSGITDIMDYQTGLDY